MASLQKNVTGQNITFAMVSTTTGLGLAGLTITGFVTKDGGAQASTAGTFTSLGNGQYNYAPTQAETNATDVGFLMTNASAITANLDFHTDLTDATGNLQVDAVRINNVATTSVTTVNANQGTTQPVNFTGTAGSALVQTDARDWNGTAMVGTVPPDAIFIRNGTAQAGGATSITLDSGASATNNFYNNEVVFIRSGTGAGQSNVITSYVGSTKVATVGSTWATNPDATSVFSVMAFGPGTATVSGTVSANVTQWLGTGVSAATAGIPDVNVKNINNAAVSTTTAQVGANVVQINGVATTPVTTINANQGTTQPINFTGTGGSATVNANIATPVAANVTQISGAAVNTATAQIGSNVVNIAGAAVNTATAQVGSNLVNIAGSPVSTTTAQVGANVAAINGSATAAVALMNSTLSICWGTASSGSTTTVVASAINNPTTLTDAGQLIGRTIIFLGTTGTTHIQSEASNITASTTGTTPTITFTAMTTSPASGDLFVII